MFDRSRAFDLNQRTAPFFGLMVDR